MIKKILYLNCYLEPVWTCMSSGIEQSITLRDWEWFQGYLLPEVRERIDIISVWAVQAESFPPVEKFSGIIVGGSAFMLSEGDDPWVSRLREYVSDAAEKKIPIFGICFGHQLLAQMFGCRVERRIPREFGRVTVELTDQGKHDPLFKDIPETVDVLMSHAEVVVGNGPEVHSLAQNSFNENQALALGDRIRTVQFHPEFPLEMLELIWHRRKDVMAEEGIDIEKAKASLQETDQIRLVLSNFVTYFCLD
jgi:GMP synthase (glutamine-hydrolysing)